MERRDFIAKLIAGGIGTFAFTELVEGVTIVPRGPGISISDLIQASWPLVVAEIHRHGDYAWLLHQGKIVIEPVVTDKLFNTGIAWTSRDEERNPTENNKISLVNAMLTNAVYSMDAFLEEQLERYDQIVLGQNCLYQLSETYKIPDETLDCDMFICTAHTSIRLVGSPA
jgi:hypothetical protein